jgi:DNA-binding transcriptional LysR family regulator
MSFSLDQLRYFIAVAEEQNISRAAERLGIQQPPLSQQIKALEAAMKVQLFWRRARGVELTEAGLSLLADARIIIERVGHAVERTRRTARGEFGRLNIGVAPTGPFHPAVPQALRTFRERYPQVHVAIEEVLSNQALERLRGETIDVAFLRANVADQHELSVYRLLDEPLIVAMPSAHALAVSTTPGGPIGLIDLAAESFIVFGGRDGPGLTDATTLACAQAGFSPIIGQEAPRITTTLGLVAAGLGVSLVPESISRVKMDGVSYRSLRGNDYPKAVLNLAHRRGDPSQTLRNFVELTRRLACGFAEGNPSAVMKAFASSTQKGSECPVRVIS